MVLYKFFLLLLSMRWRRGDMDPVAGSTFTYLEGLGGLKKRLIAL